MFLFPVQSRVDSFCVVRCHPMNQRLQADTTSSTRSRLPSRTIGRPSPISTRLLRPITRRAALPRWRSEWKSVGTVFLHKNAHKPKTPRGGENSNEVHAPVKDHVQPAKGQLDDIWSLFWVMFVMWGVLFHSFHSCLEETNTIISSKSGLEPKQVLLLTALPTNLIVGLRFTAHPGIHRVLYLPGWWSSDFVDEMLGVVRFYHEFPRWYPLPEIRQLAAVNLLASWGVYVRSDQNPDRKLLYIHEAIWELQWTIRIQ